MVEPTDTVRPSVHPSLHLFMQEGQVFFCGVMYKEEDFMVRHIDEVGGFPPGETVTLEVDATPHEDRETS